MAELFLPESVREALVQEELTEQERYWNPILRQIDPYLKLVRPMRDPPPEMIPNRWHIVRASGIGDPLFIPLVGPGGSYEEMDDGMLEELRRQDMWSSRSVRLAREAQEARERARKRAREREREDRIGSLTERIWHKENLSLRVPRSIG